MLAFRLLDAFRAAFEGEPYLHRRSTIGDRIAIELFEDLYELNRSTTLRERIDGHSRVVNRANRRRGVIARRGDGTFGELIPRAEGTVEEGFVVARGPVATVEIGVEVKILAKAMLKQIDRVGSDLVKQVEHFRRAGGNPVTVGIVGINQSAEYTSYEGDRMFVTDGKRYQHPQQEARAAEERLLANAKPAFDAFIILRFRATNVAPFRFEWVDGRATELDYAADLTRVLREYEIRFRQ
jgi:hypothetical protein